MTNPARSHHSPLTGTLLERLRSRSSETAPSNSTLPLGEAALSGAERDAYLRHIRAEIDAHPNNEVFIAKFSPRFTGPVAAGAPRVGKNERLYDDFQIYGRRAEDGSFPSGSQRAAGIARAVLATPAFNAWMAKNPTTAVFANLAIAPEARMLVYRTTPELTDATGQICRATYAVPLSASTADGFMARVRTDPSLVDELFARSSFAELFSEEDGVRRRPTDQLALIDIPPAAYGAIERDPSLSAVTPYIQVVPCEIPPYVIAH